MRSMFCRRITQLRKLAHTADAKPAKLSMRVLSRDTQNSRFIKSIAMQRFFSASSKGIAARAKDSIALLESYIQEKQTLPALTLINGMEEPPSATLLQRLVVLLSKKDTSSILSASRLLKKLYMSPSFQPNEHTPVAFIYLIDACLKKKLLSQAMEIYYEAQNIGVLLDLQLHNDLIRSLCADSRLDEARDVLKDMLSGNNVHPSEDSFLSIVYELINDYDFHEALNTINDCRQAGVAISANTYTDIINSLPDENSTDLDTLMEYLDMAIENDHGELINETMDMLIGDQYEEFELEIDDEALDSAIESFDDALKEEEDSPDGSTIEAEKKDSEVDLDPHSDMDLSAKEDKVGARENTALKKTQDRGLETGTEDDSVEGKSKE